MTGYRCGVAMLLALGMAAGGCSPQARVQVPAPAAAPAEAPDALAAEEAAREPAPRVVLPDPAFVKGRLLAYEEKLMAWQTLAHQAASSPEEVVMPPQWEDCLAAVDGIYDRYIRLQEQESLTGGPFAYSPEERVEPWQVIRQDVGYLESRCEAVYAAGHERLAEAAARQAEPAKKLEGIISRYVENRRYQDALTAYRHLERQFPDWQPAPETRQAYGLALLYTGKPEKAVQMLKATLPSLPPMQQLASKRLVADLLYATFQLEEAKTLYQGLSLQFTAWQEDERWVADQLAILESVDPRSEAMAAYVSLLRQYLIEGGRRVPAGLEKMVAQIEADYPGSIMAQRAQQLLQFSREQAGGWVEARLGQAASLAANKDFQEAQKVLKDLLQGNLPGELRPRVQALLDEVVLAENQEREKDRLRMEQDHASRWEEASHLLDLEQYDEARKILASLEGTEYEAQARVRLQEAANLAAIDLRRQAAALFVKARETVNPERKLEILLESWGLLKSITEKYPEADIISKVERNLQVLDEHIRELSPGAVLEHPPSADAGSTPLR